MKRILWNLAILVTVGFCQPPRKTAVIVSDVWNPYSSSENGDHGFTIELMEKVLASQGWHSKYQVMPFLRAVDIVKKQPYHILACAVPEARANMLITKEPIAYCRWVFVTRKGAGWTYHGARSLASKRLGIVGGYSYSPEVNEYLDKNRGTPRIDELFTSNSQIQNLQKLVRNRIDVYLEDESVVRYWSGKLGIADSIQFAGLDTEFPLYVGVHKGNPELATLLDAGIRRLKGSDTLKQLLRKYGITNWK